MPEIVSDIIVTGAKIYYAPTGTTQPLASLAANAAWLTPWVYLGYTLEPVKLGYKFKTLDIMVQQTMNAVSRFRISEELKFESTLAQHSADLLALALAGAAVQTAAVTGVPGYEDFYVGGDADLPVKMWGIDGSYVDEDNMRFPIRAIIWRATAAEGGELEYDREKPAGVPLQIKALADTSQTVGRHLIRITRVLEPALP